MTRRRPTSEDVEVGDVLQLYMNSWKVMGRTATRFFLAGGHELTFQELDVLLAGRMVVFREDRRL